VQDGSHTIEADLDAIMFNRVAWKMADIQTSEVNENLHQSTWELDILYAVRSSKDG
jgi:hypothetical protein